MRLLLPLLNFPKMGNFKGGLLEFPLVRSPKGEIFGGSTIHPDRVVFRINQDDSLTFIGVMSHAGNIHQGFAKREFVVSGFYY